MAAREEILARIRAALATGPGARAGAGSVPRRYRTAGERSPEAVRDLFIERVADYGGAAVAASDPRGAIGALLLSHGARRVVVPADLPPELVPAGVEAVVDDGLTADELDAVDGAVTTCAAACAETGTIALDGGPGQGRRAVTLVPDLHVCVVRAGSIVQTVPELIAALGPSARAGRPIVLVSGPSATSDIELTRVEGVHGPRRLAVVVVA